MAVQNATCPSEAMLSDFGLGKLDEAGAETIGNHLETCADCQARVASLPGDTFVGRLREAGGAAQPAPRRERTYVPGESLSNAANSTDGSSVREDGLPRRLPRPSRTADDQSRRDGLGSPSSLSAPPELTNHPDYELIKELGQGGMGTVYLAKNREMDRLEVLKVISKALLERPGARERFQQEIRSAAKLAHPNIVAAYSVLRPGDLVVFAMEYVKGQDLSQVVKQRGPLPVANAAFYLHQVALGLQHAHEKGMVHRDIKPNNLMLAIEGKKHTVKVLDFGLAKATSEKGAEAGLTKSGQMLGTPDYVAPEQTLDAHGADIRADIYSLGCTLYFLLSGGPPFQETSLYAILEAHHKRDPKPLNLVRPDVPVELATVVAKMMAKDPTKRYQTPAEVAKVLVPFFKPGPAAATPRPTEAEHAQPVSERVRETGVTAAAAPVAPLGVLVPVASLPAAEPEAPFGASTHSAARPAARTVKPPRPGSPWRPGRNTWLVGGGGALLLMASIVFFLPTKDGLIRVEIDDPQIEVAIKGTEIVLKKADNGHDVKLSAGEKTLVVERGDFKFETDKLVLKKGETVTVAVTLSAGQVKVKQGDKLLGKGKLPTVWHGWPADAPPPAIAPFTAAQGKKHQQAWAKYLKVPVEHTNNLGMKFVLIPPGAFTMGSTPAEIEQAVRDVGNDKYWQECIKSGSPQHKVILTQPIYLGVQEVTQAEYEKVMGKNPSIFAKTGPGKQKIEGMDTADHPVENVSWNDAAEFCANLSEQEKLKPFYLRSGETVAMLDGTGYQLPTEAEWEFACRAGTTTKYWTGDKDEDLPQVAWFATNSGDRTHQAGELEPNPFGLYDIHGNVLELVQDGWERSYYEQFQHNPALNPNGPSSAGSHRVICGGSWANYASCCVASYRFASGQTGRVGHVGFRVSLPVDAVRNALSKQPDAGTVVSAANKTASSDGWVALFNGKNLAGWELAGVLRSQVTVANGELSAVNNDPSCVDYLVTERADYADFQFRCEFLCGTDQSIAAIQVRSEPSPLDFGGMRGYLLTIGRLENVAPGGASCATTLSLAARQRNRFELAKQTHKAPRPGWHQLEIIATGDRIQALIDGDVVMDHHDEGRTFCSGALALQFSPKSAGRFRKLEVREPPRRPEPTRKADAGSRWVYWRCGYDYPWYENWRVFQRVDGNRWIESGAKDSPNISRFAWNEVQRTRDFVDLERPEGNGKLAIRL